MPENLPYEDVYKCLCLSLLISIILCLSFTGGCVKSDSEITDEPIVVGILLPLSGELSDRGLESLNGSILAIEEINRNGGIQTKGGRSLKYIIADSKGDETIGANLTKSLILENNVRAIIGAYQSNVAIAATSISEKYKTPFIVNTGISDIIIERGYEYTFRIVPSTDNYADTKVQFLKFLNRGRTTPVKNIALIYENSAYGTGAAMAEHKFLKKAGFTISSETTYAETDLNPLMDKIASISAENPDAIFTTTHLKDSIAIIKRLKETGYNGPVIDTGGGTITQEFIGKSGQDGEGVYSVSEFDYSLPEVQNLNARYKTRFGKNLSGASASSYQAVIVLRDAIERSLSLEREDIRDAISETNITSKIENILPDDRIAFGPDGQNDYSRLAIMQVQNNTWKTVWPEPYAESMPKKT
jgi:branched-chain amino acid transport system substrate-binding protein